MHDNTVLEEVFADYGSLWRLYRVIYKSVPCGPTMAVRVRFNKWSKTYCNDDLNELGTFADMRQNDAIVRRFFISSIVEGVDAEVSPVRVEWDPENRSRDELETDFWEAVTYVDECADAIWMDTHGCDECARLWGYVAEDDFGLPCEGYDGITRVHPECTICDGEGVAI
jgi:hypothetical protein